MSRGTAVQAGTRTPTLLVDEFTRGRYFRVEGSEVLLKAGRVEIDGDARRVLFVHPPAAAAFQIPGVAGDISFGVAMHPDVYENPRCGPCEFLVLHGDTPIFHGELDVQANPEERGWHDVTLDVEGTGASVCLLTLLTRSAGDESFRWALFSEPTFTPRCPGRGAPDGATAPDATPTATATATDAAPSDERSDACRSDGVELDAAPAPIEIETSLPADISNVHVTDPTDAATLLRLEAPAPGAAVVCIHVPRTAGTTLRAVVQRQFAPHEIQHLYGNDAMERFKRFRFLPRSARARVRLLLGHFTYGMHEHLVGPTTYVSVVREPVDRILSDYYYIVANPDHEHHRLVKNRGFSIREYMESGLFPASDNGLVRTFAGIVRSPYGSITRDHLATAKRNILQRFAVLGLTERLQETLALLEARLGWTGLYHTSQNIGARPASSRIPSEDRAVVAEYNQLDIELYEFCARVFAAEVTRQGPAFADRVEALRRTNRALTELRERSERSVQVRDYLGARRAATEAVELDPSFAPGHHLLSVATYHEGRLGPACEHAARAIAADPYDRQICLHAANLLNRSGRPDLAQGVLRMHLGKFNSYDDEILAELARLEGAAPANPLADVCARMEL